MNKNFSKRSTLPLAETLPQVDLQFIEKPGSFLSTQPKILQEHAEHLQKIIMNLLPFSWPLSESSSKTMQWLTNFAPIVQWSEEVETPGTLTITILCKTATNTELNGFILELLKRVVLPEKELSILSFRQLPFHLSPFPTISLLSAEILLYVDNKKDRLNIEKTLPAFAQELGSALKSPHYARFVLEKPILNHSQKVSSAYKSLIKILNKYPDTFDSSLFTEMSRLLLLSDQKFHDIHSYRHLARLATSIFLIRKTLRAKVTRFPNKRHLYARFNHIQLEFPFGVKPILSVIIGVCLLDQHESFEERHIVAAIKKFIQTARAVPGSFTSFPSPNNPIRLLYIELEKTDGTRFSLNEMKNLTTSLTEELKGRIEQLIPAVFMMRNEEEIMKNILSLSQEIRSPDDFPQVIISFDQQEKEALSFTIILVRALTRKAEPLKEKMLKLPAKVKYVHERTQIVGFLDKKVPKEANVFRIQIPKYTSLLRADSSVNLYLAREKVAAFLENTIGIFRDYNGGMILKQGELFSQFKLAFLEISKKNTDLLENFFYSISPIEMQAVLPIAKLKIFFQLFLSSINQNLPQKESYLFDYKMEENALFAFVRAADPALRSHIQQFTSNMSTPQKYLISNACEFEGTYTLGFLYTHQNKQMRKQFHENLQQAIDKWKESIGSSQILRLSFDFLPQLDPRFGGPFASESVLKLLFDGLTRIDENNNALCSTARSIDISSDKKTYIFHLRSAHWSNGAPVIAYDFEYAWKKILSPSSPRNTFSYLFYPIKNVKQLQAGKADLEDLGIECLGLETLKVELEEPTPYFLHLTAHTIYSPIHHFTDQVHPNWSDQQGEAYVCNGPFCVKNRKNGLVYLEKNKYYWDRKAVQLEQVTLSKDEDAVALDMYMQHEIDWLGKPLRDWNPQFSKKAQMVPKSYPSLGSLWAVFNVDSFPFNSAFLRRALACALDRKEISERYSEASSLPYSPLAATHTQITATPPYFDQPQTAYQLFQNALEEAGWSKNSFPKITISHSKEKTQEALFLKTSWEKYLNVPCYLEELERDHLFLRLHKGMFSVALLSWKSWIDDPLYTLDVFAHANHTVNFSNWELAHYQQVLKEAKSLFDGEKRKDLLCTAEKILMEEMPLIPLFYEKALYFRKEHLNIDGNFSNGIPDFKWLSMRKRSLDHLGNVIFKKN